MLYIEVILGLILLVAYIQFRREKKIQEYRRDTAGRYVASHMEMKKTLAMGLYFRFKKETDERPPNYSKLYLKEDPYAFEYFAAEVIQQSRGGDIWVSPQTGDQGIDFEHTLEGGLYLGQVKCYEGDLGYEPIAIVHSNMVKRGAKGGYVITTGSFTRAARGYAQGLNVELVNGVALVEEWIAGLKKLEAEIMEFNEE